MVSKIKEKSIANNAVTAAKFSSDVSFLTLKVTSIGYVGDDTAANTGGGDVITINGSGFTPNTTVYVDRTQSSVVTYVSPTQLTFTSPAKAAGSYILYLYNTDGTGSATYIPGINYSGVPTWSTASGSISTTYELTSFTGNVTTLSASSNSTVYYLVNSGSLPPGATLNANTGVISGNTGAIGSQTAYNFVIEAKDQENQGTLRNFSITVNPDVVTWSSPADGTTVTAYEYGSISQALNATSATGRAVAYTANTLPTGVSISGNTISGTPSVVGTNNSLITATSNTTNKTATRNINFQINPDVVTWSSPANETLYNITVGGSVTQALNASSAAGRSITYSANTLPGGLSISGSNITGTPNTVANTTSLITATSATTNRTATRTLLWYAKSVAGAPTIGTATATGTTTATVTFTAPASNGNSPITSYTAVSSPGGVTGTLTQSGSGTISISGLTAGTTYTFTVYATNAAGNSSSSASSNSISLTSVPGAPTIGSATATGQTTATVSFSAPGFNGGATITSYTAVSSPGGITGTLNQAGSGTISISGLSASTSYTFTVYATNSVGNSSSSSSSNQITTAASTPTSVEYLVVAGGGGGGGKRGGGGGAGGYRTSTLSVAASTAYTITVGGGGAGAPTGQNGYNGSSGSDSTFASITSTGGGYGGGYTINGSGGYGNGGYGASGGSGGGGNSTDNVYGSGGSGIGGQGNNGGGASNSNTPWGGGGGGGAGGVGGNVASNGNNGATGGSSASSSITGTSTAYAGGGGGGSYQVAYSGGSGGGAGAGAGGGNGGGSSASPGNLGSGGGGAGDNQDYTGGSGSSGVVVIAYPNTFNALSSISGGLGYDQPTRSGYRVYRFYSGTGPIQW
jgi:hypothetical protein